MTIPQILKEKARGLQQDFFPPSAHVASDSALELRTSRTTIDVRKDRRKGIDLNPKPQTLNPKPLIAECERWSPPDLGDAKGWVAVKEFELSCHDMDMSLGFRV